MDESHCMVQSCKIFSQDKTNKKGGEDIILLRIYIFLPFPHIHIILFIFPYPVTY